MESRRDRTEQKNIFLSCPISPRLYARSRLYEFDVWRVNCTELQIGAGVKILIERTSLFFLHIYKACGNVELKLLKHPPSLEESVLFLETNVNI